MKSGPYTAAARFVDEGRVCLQQGSEDRQVARACRCRKRLDRCLGEKVTLMEQHVLFQAGPGLKAVFNCDDQLRIGERERGVCDEGFGGVSPTRIMLADAAEDFGCAGLVTLEDGLSLLPEL